MKKKKLIAVFLSLALMASVVTGCGNPQGGAGDSQTPAEEKNVEANTGEAGIGYHKGVHIGPAAFHSHALYFQDGLGCGKWF